MIVEKIRGLSPIIAIIALLSENDQIICPRHGARFSIKTGEALTAPAYEWD